MHVTTTMAILLILKWTVRVWQLSGCGCIVVVEFVHTTPLLSYTLRTVNYEPYSFLAYFFAVDKTRYSCKSIDNKVGVVRVLILCSHTHFIAYIHTIHFRDHIDSFTCLFSSAVRNLAL